MTSACNITFVHYIYLNSIKFLTDKNTEYSTYRPDSKAHVLGFQEVMGCVLESGSILRNFVSHKYMSTIRDGCTVVIRLNDRYRKNKKSIAIYGCQMEIKSLEKNLRKNGAKIV